MLKISTESISENEATIKLEGDATVEHAEELRTVILEALQSVDNLHVDCGQVTACDVFVLQLLCSAHRSAFSWDKCLTFAGQPSTAVVDVIHDAGFLREHGCSLCPKDQNCMWTANLLELATA